MKVHFPSDELVSEQRGNADLLFLNNRHTDKNPSGRIKQKPLSTPTTVAENRL